MKIALAVANGRASLWVKCSFVTIFIYKRTKSPLTTISLQSRNLFTRYTYVNSYTFCT